MSYKNPKTNKTFESYNNGERSHMVSGDALNAIGDSHKKFQDAIENGKKLGDFVADSIIKHREEKRKDAEWNDAQARDKKTLDEGGSISSGGKEYKKVKEEEETE